MGRDWIESCGPDSAGAERVEEDKVSKFKVGDRVRMTERGHEYQGEDPSNPRGVIGNYRPYTSDFGRVFGYKHSVDWDNGENNNYRDGEIELVSEYCNAARIIQLNHQYTSKNGKKWECIAIRGDVAWMVGVYEGKADGAAYMYKLDGSAVCLRTSPHVYDIKWEPMVEWVTFALKQEHSDRTHYASLRYPLIDGKPDFTQATVTPV